MAYLTRGLDFFRGQFKAELEQDNGTGNYLADIRDETINLRDYEDVGIGAIGEETATDYVGYQCAMGNFRTGFEKTMNEIERLWKEADVVENPPKMANMWVDALEKGRKIAAQE